LRKGIMLLHIDDWAEVLVVESIMIRSAEQLAAPQSCDGIKRRGC
jgi:hypothetical protein